MSDFLTDPEIVRTRRTPLPVARPVEEMPQRPLYCFGLDLGQIRDYSALAIIEAIPTPYEFPGVEAYGLPEAWQVPDDLYVYGPPIKMNLRWIERFERNMRYTVIADMTRARLLKVGGDKILAIDATGVGRGVIDIFDERGLTAMNITITSGDSITINGPEIHVPKRDLVHGLLVRYQNGELAVSRQLEYAEALTQELTGFKVKTSKAGNQQFEAWRESEHDDLVLAVAIAVWAAEHEIEALMQQALAALQMAEIAQSARAQISTF